MSRKDAGFTLIEIALAILVVAIGVLAVFALMSAGLDNSARAADETHAALFADDVFNALRTMSDFAAENQNQLPGTTLGSTNCPWENFWKTFYDGNLPVPIASLPAWRPDIANLPTLVTVKATPQVIGYANLSLRGYTPESGKEIVDHAMRYQVAVSNKFNNWNVLWTNRVSVTIKVWPGQFGDTTKSDPLVFYSEFANPGDL